MVAFFSVRRLVAVAAVLGAAIISIAGLPDDAHAADPSQPSTGPSAVSSLHSVAPATLTAGDETVELTGTVRNTGDEPVRNVQVLPRFSRTPLESRAEISQVSTDTSLSWGARYDAVYDPIADVLQPGEAREFTLKVPTELLGFAASGVYVVGVDVMGSPADDESRLHMHTSRTVVTWLPDDTAIPSVQVGLLWPVASRPTAMPDNSLLDNSLASQIGTDEPLSAIVEAGADAPVTWAVDPDLLDTATIMAGGYDVVSAGGAVEGSQADSDAARQWRSALDRATSGSDVLTLPYAVPDIEALAADEPQLAANVAEQSLATSAERASSISGTTAPAAWLDRGSVTERTLGTFAEAGTNTVVVPGDAVSSRTSQAVGTFTVGDSTLEAIATDTGLDQAISDAEGTTDARAAALSIRQRWFAETAMMALSAAELGESPQPVMATPPLRWQPNSTTAQAVVDTWQAIPWVDTAGLADVRSSSQAQEFTPDAVEATNRLPDSNVKATAELHQQSARYTGLLAEPGDFVDGLTLATVRAASTGWRSDPAAGDAYARATTDEVSKRLDDVSVTVPESVTLSSRNGTFPLTVTNDLDEPIAVELDIDSANVDRLSINDVETQQVQPGERTIVQVTAQASANGKVPISVQLTTEDGATIGPARPTLVNATDYGTIGWIIVVGAGALFVAALGRRAIRRRRHTTADVDGDSDDAEPAREAHR